MNESKSLAILGSTGSVGIKCLDIVAANPGRFQVKILMAGRNLDLLEKQIKKFNVELVVVSDADIYKDLTNRLTGQSIDIELYSGSIGSMLEHYKVDLVVNALPSTFGYKSSFDCLQKGIDLALANKESMLIAGELLMKESSKNASRIIPVDSEASAIFQCLRGESSLDVDSIQLTASGGPFYKDRPEKIKKKHVLDHPVWQMGPKISVDSASMMNKVFEIGEIQSLFRIPVDKIQVVVHPESHVHSFVRFIDGQSKALISDPDMTYPIQYALSYPHRHLSDAKKKFKKRMKWNFEILKAGKFPCFDLGMEYVGSRSSLVAALVVANDHSVSEFLDGKIDFEKIPKRIDRLMQKMSRRDLKSIEEVDQYVKECQEICLSL